MKNFILLLPLLIASFFLAKCNNGAGHSGVCKNIKEAKKRKVFVCKYELKEISQMSNQDFLSIEEVWLEYKWNYPNNLGIEEIEADYQLVMKLSKESYKGYGNIWMMMFGEEEIIPTTQGITYLPYNLLPSDSIKINIYKLEKPFHFTRPKEIIKGETLGSFVLTRK